MREVTAIDALITSISELSLPVRVETRIKEALQADAVSVPSTALVGSGNRRPREVPLWDDQNSAYAEGIVTHEI